jgi:hypothetical protein
MKRVFYLLAILSFFSPAVAAQYEEHGDHAEVGVFADYFHVNETGTNLGGVGARLSVNANSYLQIEAEMAYDFTQTFTEGFDDGTGTITTERSNLRLLHGMLGPKLQTNVGPVRLFVTAKGGFVDFGLSSAPATGGTFFSTVSNLRASNVNPVFYPGGGAEAFWGPIGVRLDVGDEIYFNSGAHNNLRVAFGPTIRF